jgi:alpha-N-arabinofuranosidase
LWTLVPRLAAAVTERGPSERSVRPPRPHGRATRVLVAPGVYRESVDPALAGEENARIVYRSEKPLAAVITGAETVKTWERYRDNVWVCRIDNDVFGAYNPYTTLVAGDWYFAPPVRHTGAVYLNDRQLYETENLEECVRGEIFTPSWEPEASIYKWYTEQECGRTVIYANFQGSDPNTENVEINVRRNCFLPSRTGVDYITLSGFTVTKAATTWAPPASYQDGMIGPHWAKGWIIEDCDVSNSKCCGISLGKYLDPENDQYFTHRHVKSPTQMERDAVCRGQYHGWLKEKVGSHIVRRCRIHHCEQAGIVGRMGCVFSIIEDNDIHHINNMQQLCGAEIAGIKFHAAIDVVIRRNHIHHCTMGIWCDWQAQGTRLTQNLLHDNQAPEGTPIFDYSTVNQDIFVEVSHGPTLIDNNILLSKTSIRLCAQGVACVHNLIAGTFTSVGEGTDNAVNGVNQPRYTPYHIPHRTEVAGFMSILHGDDRFYNNIFIQKWPVSDDSGKNAQGFLLPPENKIAGTAVFDDYPTYGEWINSDDQRRGRVDAGLELVVQHVQTLGILAEKIELLDEILGVLLLLALLLDEPVQKLHGAEILGVVGGAVNVVDEGGHVSLVLQTEIQRIADTGIGLVRLGNGLQRDVLAVIQQVLVHQYGVVALLLILHLVPVAEAVQALLVVIV